MPTLAGRNLLNGPETAAILGVSTNTLGDWRKRKYGPVAIRYGGNNWFYDADEVHGFIDRLFAEAAAART